MTSCNATFLFLIPKVFDIKDTADIKISLLLFLLNDITTFIMIYIFKCNRRLGSIT